MTDKFWRKSIIVRGAMKKNTDFHLHFDATHISNRGMLLTSHNYITILKIVSLQIAHDNLFDKEMHSP